MQLVPVYDVMAAGGSASIVFGGILEVTPMSLGEICGSSSCAGLGERKACVLHEP